MPPKPSAQSIAAGETEAALPHDFNALRAVILARRAAMPKRVLQVATFAIDNPGDVAFGTVAGIAQAIGVQPSTLVRFAQFLGYSGFSQLQLLFQDHLRGKWPDYAERLKGLRSTGVADGQLEGFARASIQSIERLTASLAPDALARAIQLLARADMIYLVAARRAFPVAAYLNYAFGQHGLKRILVDHAALMAAETIGFATPRDAVLAVSFTPYTPATVDLAAQAHARDVPLVAITDSSFSPLVPAAHVWLEVAESSHAAFRSLAATMTMAMALAAGAAEARAAMAKG